MTNLVEDLNTLTTIPSYILIKLLKKVNYCITDSVVEDIIADNSVSIIDLGIGKLYIKHEDPTGNNIKYHFEPSNDLQKALRDAVKNQTNPLELTLSNSLKEKFEQLYKDLC